MLNPTLWLSGLCAASCGAQCIPSWQPPVPGIGPNAEIFALCTWDPDGAGPLPPVVVAGGNLQVPAPGVALWNGTAWQGMGGGVGVGQTVIAVTLYDADGPGPLPEMPVIGGAFTSAGGQPINRVAWWDGAVWRPFAGGLGTGGAHVEDLVVYEGDLIAAGVFASPGGTGSGLARWDGSAWHNYTAGLVVSPDDLLVDGNDLYAGGSFGFQEYSVMRRRNGVWTPIAFEGTGDPIEVHRLGLYRGEVIAASFFVLPNGYVSRYNGTDWLPLGSGVNAVVEAFTTWDPPGPAPEVLVVAGSFNWASGVTANGIATWDGQQWAALGPGLSGPGRALTLWNDDLIVGGTFGTAGGIQSPYFARYGCPDCFPDCNGDGVLTLADFGCFTTKFALGDPYADCNGDAVLNLSDFGCFTTKFALGCP